MYHGRRMVARSSASVTSSAAAGGRSAQVLRPVRATSSRSARTALLVAGPPAPGPSNETRPTGSASTSRRLRTPSVRPNGAPTGTAEVMTEPASPKSGSAVPGVLAVAMSRMARPSATAPAMSFAETPVMPGLPSPRTAGGLATIDSIRGHAPKQRRVSTASLFASWPSTSARGSRST